VLFLFGVIIAGWFYGNVSSLDRRHEPTLVATDFAKRMNPKVPLTEWEIRRVRALPGDHVYLTSQVSNITVHVELRGFLGFGWQLYEYSCDGLK
jgi:hypothetical protein